MQYTFCPLCRASLVIRQDGHFVRPRCPDCGFVYYHNPAPAAGCVVIEDGRVLLVRRAHEPFPGKWTLPAGFMEWEESPEQTAVRELLEETNLEVELEGLFHVYSGSDDPRTRAILILYFARRVRGELKAGDDAAEALWFSADEIPPDSELAFESHRLALAKLRREFPEMLRR